jgi:hypothetical protein
MKKLIVTAFIASSLITGPGMLATSTGALAQRTCDSSAPAAWFRPGGFCDAVGGSKSLTAPLDGGCTDYDYYYGEELIGMAGAKKGDRVQVALTCIIDCSYENVKFGIEALPKGDRARVAQACPT